MAIFPLNLLSRRSGVVRSIDDAAAFGVPVLGSISEFEPRPGARLPDESFPEALEAYRRLTNAVRGTGFDFQVRGRVIVVTSALFGAGRSTTAKNLATLLARGGSKVVLVDADVNRVARRRPGDGTSSSGFAGLLVNQLMRPGNALLHTMDLRLKLLPAGSVAGSADGLLQSSRLPLVVAGLRELADYVIFDVAPVEEDLLHLTRQSDATLVVLRSGATERKDVSKAVSLLRGASSGLLGIVLNRAPLVIEAPRVEPAPPMVVEEAVDEAACPGERLEIAVDELLADLEAAVQLVRDIRLAGEADDALEAEDAELVGVDR